MYQHRTTKKTKQEIMMYLSERRCFQMSIGTGAKSSGPQHRSIQTAGVFKNPNNSVEPEENRGNVISYCVFSTTARKIQNLFSLYLKAMHGNCRVFFFFFC